MNSLTAVIGKPVENRYLVREKDRRRTRDLGAVALGLAPLALVLLGFAWSNVEVIRRGYDLQRRASLRDELREDNRRLRGKLAELASLGAVEIIARRDLGLASARPERVIWVERAQRP